MLQVGLEIKLTISLIVLKLSFPEQVMPLFCDILKVLNNITETWNNEKTRSERSIKFAFM